VDVELYLAGVTGIDDRQSAARVFARTAGHPFFVVELVRLLLSPSGAHALAADSPDVPGGVRDVVRARVGRLPGPTRTLLAAAAVLGDHATMDLLEAATGLSGDRMLDAVEPALVTRIAMFPRADAALTFTHSLVRHAVAQEVTTLRRARILAAAVAAAAGWETDPARVTALADLALTAGEAAADRRRAVARRGRSPRRRRPWSDSRGRPHAARRRRTRRRCTW
jgi:predicted ATPase